MIMRQFCIAKIHRLKVTESCIDYDGSLTIDENLLDAAGMKEGERVQVININNGERFETYLLAGERNSGKVCLNGGAARMGLVNDLIIVISYAIVDEKEIDKLKPKVVLVDQDNKIREVIK